MELRDAYELPENCPPLHAQDITKSMTAYRILMNVPPKEADFLSWPQLKGRLRPTDKVSECKQRGVSLYASLESARSTFEAYRDFNNWIAIGRLTLTPCAGKIELPNADNHQTWWPAVDYDPIANCEVLL